MKRSKVARREMMTDIDMLGMLTDEVLCKEKALRSAKENAADVEKVVVLALARWLVVNSAAKVST